MNIPPRRWIRFDPGNPPSSLSSQFEEAATLFPTEKGLGWLITKDEKAALPILCLRENHAKRFWIQPEGNADLRGARKRISASIQETLAHFISHDINGKIMGIDGVLECWNDEMPEPPAALEDLKMIRSSLAPLHPLSQLLSWLRKENPMHDRVFTLNEVHETFTAVLSRLFKPSNSFQLLPLTSSLKTKSALSSPYPIAFWPLATGLLLSAFKNEGKTSQMEILIGDNPPVLILKIKNQTLLSLFNDEEKNPPEIFWDWLSLLTFQSGSWQQSGEWTELFIPLKSFQAPSEETFIGFGDEKDFLSSPSLKIVDNFSTPEAVEAIIPHLFELEGILLGKSLEDHQCKIIMHLADSIQEIKLIDQTSMIQST